MFASFEISVSEKFGMHLDVTMIRWSFLWISLLPGPAIRTYLFAIVFDIEPTRSPLRPLTPVLRSYVFETVLWYF
jgi:hypothetical protein